MTHTSRRAFLHGLGGAALSLPWLERLGLAAPNQKPAQRAAFFYVPIGVVRRGFFPGEENGPVPKFTSDRKALGNAARIPVGVHPLTLTPTLQPLEKVKDKVTLITGMDRAFQPGTDVHAQCASCFLTSAGTFTVKQSPYPQARTLDHILGEQLGADTPFRTLEFSSNSHKDNKESIHFDNVSWYGTGHVAPSMRDPRKAYRRLFGTHELRAYRNITDLVLGNAKSLEKKLGPRDREKFGEYLEAIRVIEKRMDRMDAMKAELVDYKTERPNEHLPHDQYIDIMGDLLVTALQAGLTHVGTLMVGPERWQTTKKYTGILDQPRSHHGMSHNQSKFVDDLLKLDRFHVGAFARLLENMDAIEEANGTTLLDNTIFTMGAGLGDGSTHQYNDLPLIVAGGGGGKLKLGKHVQCERGTPLSNLWLTQLQALGIKRDRYADSTGTLDAILA